MIIPLHLSSILRVLRVPFFYRNGLGGGVVIKSLKAQKLKVIYLILNHLFDRIITYKMRIHCRKGWLLVVMAALLININDAANLPNCHTSQFYQTLPLVPEEAFIFDLNALFSGYNLQFNVTVDPDIEQYVKVGHKTQLLNFSYPDVPFTGLKSYHLSSVGNSWGPQFIALAERGERTLVHYGILSDNVSVPVINNYITVENLTNTTCFDATQIPANNLIIVDCMQKRTLNNSRGQPFDNIFYYFKISDGSKVKELKTECYAAFQQQERRRLDLYSDLLSTHSFLLRTYFADGVAGSAKDNTYLEVLMVEDPLQPWTVGIIDRTFLRVPQVWISDVRIYNGEIFLLDQLKGVFRIYISGSEDLHFQGYYQARGFTKMAVYSSNLDNRVELGLSNSHVVQEIDWTDINNPRLLNKYSLLPQSTVHQLFMNDRFIFVRSSASDGTVSFFYTWTFIRGDRTFARAFAVMSHDTDSTFVDFNAQLSYLMVVGEESISNYAYDDPSFVLRLDHNQELYDRVRSFVVTASSEDPKGAGDRASCQLMVNFTLLEENNRTMWVVGGALPSKVSANYPGMVKLQLGEYILGPNVTYNIRQTQKDQLKKAKVFQLQQLNTSWSDMAPPFTNVTFLQTQTFAGAQNDTVLIYTQDSFNKTYISECNPDHQLLQVLCNLTQVKSLGGQITNWHTSMVLEPFSQDLHHILSYTTEQFYNTVFVEDLTAGHSVDQVLVGNGFPGNISSVSITGKYMYVVTRHVKRVNIYSLEECLDENCFPICSINHLNMFRLGLKYFSPRLVHSSQYHPDVLFIKTEDTIIAVDVSRECVPKLLAVVRPVENTIDSFVFEVNANYLVVTVVPDTVQEYDLSRIYLKQIRATKRYPLYGFKLPRDYDFDISDYGNCVYLSTVSDGGDYNIQVYRSGLPAIGSLYNQIDLNTFQKVLMDASGYRVDYVSVVTSKQFRLFRQYQKPELQVLNPSKDYQFYLEYQNAVDSARLELIQVQIINLPTNIAVNPRLLDIMNTKDLLYSGQKLLNQVNDMDWYEGNVLYIEATCKDCPEKVSVNNHIQKEGILIVMPNLTAYAYAQRGGQLLAERALLSLRSNGSVDQVSALGADYKRRCVQVGAGRASVVVGCKEGDEVWLQVVSEVGRKPFAFEAQQVAAKGLLKLQISNEIVMVVDVEQDQIRPTKKGGILLLQLDDQLTQDQPLSQIQYIDGDDFGMRELGDIYVGNAELIFNPDRNVYFLYVTEAKRGLLIMQFSHTPGMSDIIIRRTHLVQLKPMIQQLDETMPYDASFQAVTVISSYTNNQSKLTVDRLLITTARYHTIQVVLTIDMGSSLLSSIIEQLYLRYSYYQVSNQIKAMEGLFMIQQILPAEYDGTEMNQQLYTVYSTQVLFNGTVGRKGLVGALPLAQHNIHRFDFNRTQQQDGHSLPRVGVVVVQEKGEIIRASLHRNLSILTTQLLDTQIIYLNLINDFSIEQIRVLLNGRAPYPEWKLITIIIFSIIGGLLFLVVGVVLVKKLKQGGVLSGKERQTLMTEELQT